MRRDPETPPMHRAGELAVGSETPELPIGGESAVRLGEAKLTVCFFCDRAALPGLHVTLLTLLRASRGGRALKLIVFTEAVSEEDRKILRRTFDSNCSVNDTLEARPFVSERVRGANSLHGNFTAYGRLALAELLPDEEYVVYLDCDLVVGRDLEPLLASPEAGQVLRVDGTGRRKSSLDRELFRMAGLDLDGPCFNSGVMGIDLKLWRERDCARRCREVIRQFAGRFRSADQAVLNVALADDFCALGREINDPLYPSSKRVVSDPQGRIYHFVGSPKPWDLFASNLHTNYLLWRTHYDASAAGGLSPLGFVSAGRALRVSRATLALAWQRARAGREGS